jgi:pimeloyl-ACP methyl ester carboxylesterase
MNTRQLIQRAKLVIKNLPYLPKVLHPLDESALWSELRKDNYESAHHFHKALLAVIYPVYAPFRDVPHLPYEVPEKGQVIDDNQIWFFLNGISTNRSVLRLNGKALADLFQRKIWLMHNPSDGIILDLLESAVGRTMQMVSTLESSVAQILEEALNTHRRVILLAHSQGGIIATGALYRLAKNLSGSRSRALKKLEVYTFASAATELNLPQVYAEHFYHKQDYIARIGVAGNPERFSGRSFEYNATGHLLNTHYLKNLVENKFVALDGGASRLVERLHIKNLDESLLYSAV